MRSVPSFEKKRISQSRGRGSMNNVSPEKMIFRNTHAHLGRRIAVTPANSSTKHLCYGRIILDQSRPSEEFSTGDRETGLDLVHRLVVGRAVGLGPPDDPHGGRRGGQRGDSPGQRSRPARRDQRVMLLSGSGGAPSRGGSNTLSVIGCSPSPRRQLTNRVAATAPHHVIQHG